MQDDGRLANYFYIGGISMTTPVLGRVGIWSMEMRFGEPSQIAAAAAEMDEQGFGTLWIPGGIDDGVLASINMLLGATRRMTIASGILNIWKHKPEDVAAWFHALPEAQQARTLLGIGVSHGPIIGDAWQKPLAVTRNFLDGLAAAGMPADNLCLAALGPKMVALARDRSAGAHPYLTTPEHTATARQILGPGKILAPEQGVILAADAGSARARARQALAIYSSLPNYRNNWLRLGLTEQDIDEVSDHLVDALFAWGEVGAISDRVRAHHDAGADHVCVQAILETQGADVDGLRAAARQLADALL